MHFSTDDRLDGVQSKDTPDNGEHARRVLTNIDFVPSPKFISFAVRQRLLGYLSNIVSDQSINIQFGGKMLMESLDTSLRTSSHTVAMIILH